jgi:uncharacterized protein with FMN-binding domain
MAKHRVHPGLAALSASAIAAVYAVGYVHTQPVEDSVASALAARNLSAIPTATVAAEPNAAREIVIAPTATPAASQPAVIARATATPSGAGSAQATATPAAVATYRDGTYSGSGRSRFGDVQVAVTIQSGRISNVALTRVTTRYPASRIAALPGQVVARQSAQVDNVSGATASASAFRSAVQAALAQAR